MVKKGAVDSEGEERKTRGRAVSVFFSVCSETCAFVVTVEGQGKTERKTARDLRERETESEEEGQRATAASALWKVELEHHRQQASCGLLKLRPDPSGMASPRATGA